jgi:hypothetical protein
MDSAYERMERRKRMVAAALPIFPLRYSYSFFSFFFRSDFVLDLGVRLGTKEESREW